MERAQLGGSGLEVSRIGLGTWAIGGWGWGGSDDDDAVRTIRRAVESGITLVDTAPIYGGGRAEELVGRALSEGGLRDRVVLATKAGLTWENGARRDGRPARIRQEIEDSLRRLRTDVVDLYQIHWPDPKVPLEETARVMRELVDEGKIRAVGVSNFSPAQMERFRAVCPLHASQPPYNLFERAIEEDVLPWCAKNGVAVLAYGPLCRGLLSGRMRPDTTFSQDDLRGGSDPKFREPWFPRYLRAVERLEALARRRYGRSVLALALRFVLDQPGVTVALWGARKPSQLDALQDAQGWRLDDEGRAEIERILEEEVPGGPGPEFMAPAP